MTTRSKDAGEAACDTKLLDVGKKRRGGRRGQS